MVRVDVVERQSGRAIGVELRRDFQRELASRRGPEDDRSPHARQILAQQAVLVDEVRDARRRKQRSAVDDHHVQADAQ